MAVVRMPDKRIPGAGNTGYETGTEFGSPVAVNNSTNQMSKGERIELAKVARMRAKIAKAAIDQRKAGLLADFEEQLAAEYKADNEAWSDITAHAKARVAELDAEIAERCRALGVPERFRPGLQLGWYQRGESATAARRSELRKVAQSRIDERAKAAKVEVDRQAADLATQLIAGGLESSAAREFLDSMASIDNLMPPLSLPELGEGSESGGR
jgi:hypothetical protein